MAAASASCLRCGSTGFPPGLGHCLYCGEKLLAPLSPPPSAIAPSAMSSQEAKPPSPRTIEASKERLKKVLEDLDLEAKLSSLAEAKIQSPSQFRMGILAGSLQLNLDIERTHVLRDLLLVEVLLELVASVRSPLSDLQAENLSLAIERTLAEEFATRQPTTYTLSALVKTLMSAFTLTPSDYKFSAPVTDIDALLTLLHSLRDAFTAWHAAFQTSNCEKTMFVVEFAKNNPHVAHHSGPHGNTLLWCCAVAQPPNFPLLRELITQCNCPINEPNKLRLETPLHAAVECGDRTFPVVRFLLEHGANAKAVDSRGYTPIHIASLPSTRLSAPVRKQLLDLLTGKISRTPWQFQRSDGSWVPLPVEEAIPLQDAIDLRLANVYTFSNSHEYKIDLSTLLRQPLNSDEAPSWLRKKEEPTEGKKTAFWQWQMPSLQQAPAHTWHWEPLEPTEVVSIDKEKWYAVVKPQRACATCKTAVPSEAKFCPKDGQTLPPSTFETAVRYLPHGNKAAAPAGSKRGGHADIDFVDLAADDSGSEDEGDGANVLYRPRPSRERPESEVHDEWRKENPGRDIVVLPDIPSGLLPEVQQLLANSEGMRSVYCAATMQRKLALFGPREDLKTASTLIEAKARQFAAQAAIANLPLPGLPPPAASQSLVPISSVVLATLVSPSSPVAPSAAGVATSELPVPKSTDPPAPLSQQQAPAEAPDGHHGEPSAAAPALPSPSPVAPSATSTPSLPVVVIPKVQRDIYMPAALHSQLAQLLLFNVAEIETYLGSPFTVKPPPDAEKGPVLHIDAPVECCDRAFAAAKRLERLASLSGSSSEYFERRSRHVAHHAPAGAQKEWRAFRDAFDTAVIEVITTETAAVKENMRSLVNPQFTMLVFRDAPTWEEAVLAMAKNKLERSGLSATKVQHLRETAFKAVFGGAEAGSPLARNLATIERQLPDAAPSELPALVFRAAIFQRASAIGLAMHERSRDLLDLIKDKQVVCLTTGTGSGKSSLVPPLLFADGHRRIVVTQPRRFPCQSLFGYVEKTFGQSLCGWKVAGAEHQASNPLVYVTDGLLREQLIALVASPPSTPEEAKEKLPYDVIVLDEIHERSFNMDVCIAGIAKLLSTRCFPHLRVVLASATLDPDVIRPLGGPSAVDTFDYQPPRRWTIVDRPAHGRNPVDVVKELFESPHRAANEQILCFVPSVRDVRECIALFKALTNGYNALPLYAQQSAPLQEQILKQGSVFFATNVAETSLTIPNLRYVVDTGKTTTAAYNHDKFLNELKVQESSDATRKQRRGRVGRTCNGEYWPLYDQIVPAPRAFPVPSILTVDLVDIEFALLRSFVQHAPEGGALVMSGLSRLQRYLPTPPPDAAIASAQGQLHEVGVLTQDLQRLTHIGTAMMHLPMLGGARLTRAVYSALTVYRCGRDLIRLAAMLMTGESATVLMQAAPRALKSVEDGDIFTLKRVFDAVWAQCGANASPASAVDGVCARLSINNGSHVLRRAVRTYTQLDTAFATQRQLAPYRNASQQYSDAWEPIARALLTAYPKQVFVSQAAFQGCKPIYQRIHEPKIDGLIGFGSTIARPPAEQPVEIVLAKDAFMTSLSGTQCQLSLVGRLKFEWVQTPLQRALDLTQDEQDILRNQHLAYPGVDPINVGPRMALRGAGGAVLNAEIEMRKLLTKVERHNLMGPNVDAGKKEIFKEVVIKRLLKPLAWRWGNDAQAKVTVHASGEVDIEARSATRATIKQELDSLMGWLRFCDVFRNPFELHCPQHIPTRPRDIEERIAAVTDPNQTKLSLWLRTNGPNATRESRMEAFAWLAVTELDCVLEGGFVRDWIVGGRQLKPAGLPIAQWLDQNSLKMHDLIVPSDLDFHLPPDRPFSVERFLAGLRKIGLEVDRVVRDGWRYRFVVDSNRGPFLAEFIEPHVTALHDRIDFDVSNLLVRRSWTAELGLRLDTTHEPCCATVESIVKNIQQKKMRVFRPLDRNMKERIQKMQARGWAVIDDNKRYYAPPKPIDGQVTSTKLPVGDPTFDKYAAAVHGAIAGSRVVTIEMLANPERLNSFNDEVKRISRECGGNPNERELFHGTKAAGADGIPTAGFDERYFARGAWGPGAYFADTPRKSHGFTAADANGNRVMFVVRVLLGKQEKVDDPDNGRYAAKIGFHSLWHPATRFAHCEYIIFRHSQAYAWLKITYKA